MAAEKNTTMVAEFWVGREIDTGLLVLYDPQENQSRGRALDGTQVCLFVYRPRHLSDCELVFRGRVEQRAKVKTVWDPGLRTEVIVGYMRWLREYGGSGTQLNGVTDIGWVSGMSSSGCSRTAPVFYGDYW